MLKCIQNFHKPPSPLMIVLNKNSNEEHNTLHAINLLPVEGNPLTFRVLRDISPTCHTNSDAVRNVGLSGPFRQTRSAMKLEEQLFLKKPVVKIEPINLTRVISEHGNNRLRSPRRRRVTAKQKKTSKTFSERLWKKEEIARLRKAVCEIPTRTVDYWNEVAKFVGSRSANECFKTFNDSPSLQKIVHRSKMFGEYNAPSTRRKVNQNKPKRPTKLSRNTANKSNNVQVITATKGTMKRRKQIRNVIATNAATKWNKSGSSDEESVCGGLTQMEREELMGNFSLSPSISFSGNASILTAGGAALSMSLEDGNASGVSSAFELPNSSDVNLADKFVTKLRTKSGRPTKRSASQTITAMSKKMCHLEPISFHRLQCQSSPVTQTSDDYSDDDRSTLVETNASLSDNDDI